MTPDERHLWECIAESIYCQCPGIYCRITDYIGMDEVTGLTLKTKDGYCKLSVDGILEKDVKEEIYDTINLDDLHDKDETGTFEIIDDKSDM